MQKGTNEIRRVAQTKKSARAEVIGRLKDLSAFERRSMSLAACRRVEELDAFSSAAVVMLYMPLPTELDVTSLALRCLQLGKSICVPRMEWDTKRMVAIRMERFDDQGMRLAHGVREPVEGAPVPAEDIDLILCPGLAFDGYGRRLGRGGGVYDRFLVQPHLRAAVVGIGFDVQVLDEVPVWEHDVPLHAVVTDLRAITLEHCR